MGVREYLALSLQKFRGKVFKVRTVEEQFSSLGPSHEFKRVLGPIELIFMGVGSVIG